MGRKTGNIFVSNGVSRRDTAALLVGTAAEYGLPADSVFATAKGFYITDELDLLLDERYGDDMSAINNGVETGPQGLDAPVEVIMSPLDPELIALVSGNPETDAGDEDEGYYDPDDYSVETVKTDVTEAGDADFALAVLELEKQGKARATLIKWLTEFAATQTSGDRAEENTNIPEEE